MTSGYPVSVPVEFTRGSTGQGIKFNAKEGENIIEDFVTVQPGDMLVRSQGTLNTLSRLPPGSDGQVLKMKGGMPLWSTEEKSRADANELLSVRAATTKQPVPSGVWTTVGGDVAQWSCSSHHDCTTSAFDSVTGTYTAHHDGCFMVSGSVSFEGNATATGKIPDRICARQACIVAGKVGSGIIVNTQESQSSPFSGNPTTLTFPMTCVMLKQGEQLFIQVRHDASTPIYLNVIGGSVSFCVIPL